MIFPVTIVIPGFTNYMFKDGKIVEEPDFVKFAEWFANVQNRTVERTTVGKREVSTVFIGIDKFQQEMGWTFETAVMDEEGKWDVRRRYATLEDAVKGHKRYVEETRKLLEYVQP